MEGTYTLPRMIVTDSEFQDISETRVRMADDHALCGGLGLLYSDREVRDCACRRSMTAYARLVRARIPRNFRLSCPDSQFEGDLLFGEGKTSALVSALMRKIKEGLGCVYCTATQIDRWCGDEKKHEILLDRVRGSAVVAIDDLHLLGSRFPSQAVPALLHELKDSGVAILGAGEPRDGWDVFSGRCEVTTHTCREIDFYELGDEYGII